MLAAMRSAKITAGACWASDRKLPHFIFAARWPSLAASAETCSRIFVRSSGVSSGLPNSAQHCRMIREDSAPLIAFSLVRSSREQCRVDLIVFYFGSLSLVLSF